ncbi:MAG TPA: TIM44-like domain-containing protein, partial [Candidatus Ozemobacteraceae bacterium]|nr:TIM44-like domain-containing protein [Candidatus Ozemobacteraceae bacterium]
PLKAIPTLLLFLLPATWWHRSRLGWKGLIGIWTLLVLYSWFVLQELVVAVMIFPTFHLLAYRTSRFIDQRYPGRLRDVSTERKVLPATPEGLLGEGIFSEMVDRLWQSFCGIMAQSVGENTPEEVASEKVEVLQMQFQDPRQMSRALTDLVRRDGSFKEKPFLKRVEDVFWKVQKALYSQDLAIVQPFVSDGLFEQLQVRVEEQQAVNIRYQVSDMGIYDLRFVQVHSDHSFDTMHVLVRAYAHEEQVDESRGERQRTEGGRRQFDEVWAFLRRPDAKTLERPGLLEGFCPNCSAPIEIGQAARCKACDAFLRAGTHDWVLFQITPACEWHYGEPEEIPGMRDLRMVDPTFTVQHIEDRSAVIFWKERQAERTGQVEPLRRFVLPESCDRLEQRWRELGDDREYQEFCALGKVRLKAILSDPDWDRLYVETVWSGVPKALRAGKARTLSTNPRFFRKILVLRRRHGLATCLDSALSSSHCHSCGAPAKAGFNSRCDYCQAILNEGDTAWVLDWWVGEDDPDLLKALSQRVEQKVVVPQVFAEGGSRLDTVAALAQMMLADGVVDAGEMKLLQTFAAGHGIPPVRVEQVIQSLREGWIHLPKLDKRQDAHHLLQSAVRMALADGVIVEAEMEMLHQLARHLGYSEADVKYLLARHHKKEYQDQRRLEQPRCFSGKDQE